MLFLAQVVRHRAWRCPPAQLSAEQLATFDGLSVHDRDFDSYIDVALDNLGRGVSVAYTLIGCQLRLSTGESSRQITYLRCATGCDDVPMHDMTRMAKTLGEQNGHWVLRAWMNCATQTGYARILNETQWESLTSDVADRWLSLFQIYEGDIEDPVQRAAHWRVRLGMFPALHRHLLALPATRRAKFAHMQYCYVCGWEDHLTLQASWPILLPLQLALCQAPLSSSLPGEEILSAMAAQLQMDGWKQLAAAPERSWITVERACRRENRTRLIRYGLNSVTDALPDLVLRAFVQAPRRLMRSMSLIGCIEYNARLRFLRQAAATPWFTIQWQAMPALQACVRLREHLVQAITLSEAQLVRHCKVTLTRLAATQLAALDALAWRHIDGPFNLRGLSTAAHHAVRLHASIDRGNKKTLRRFLLGYAKGGQHAHLDHPLNRAWYARHPRVDPALWGTDTVCHRVGDASVKIGIETDPLEVLMMGNYVGSCLALGGLCDYSSVACLVDANKQVAYARDAAGRVLARQLLAIDERDRLICFAVYPTTTDSTLREAFKQFDTRLATALGLEIYRDGPDASYEVATILAIEWWDDGVTGAK